MRSLRVVALVVALALTACGDDDSSPSEATESTETTGAPAVPITTVVPRADDDAALTDRFVPIDGTIYASALDDQFVVPVFREIVAVEGSEQVLERYAARLVADEDGEGFALLLVARLAPDYRDGRAVREVYARSQSSRVIDGQQVFVVQVVTDTETGRAYRFTWARDGFLYSAYGEDEQRVQDFVAELVAAGGGDAGS